MENTENMELLENGQDEEKMTLEKFEDATVEVKKVTQETMLVFSEYYSSITGSESTSFFNSLYLILSFFTV